jgi:hypothetical protein
MTSKNQLVFLALVLVLAVSQGPRNPWCSVYNDTTQLCSECYSGYFVRGNDCIFGNQYCNGFKNDGSGDCANCYHTDYNGPQCAYNPPVVNQPCYAGYYRAIPSGLCTLGNPNCATFNDILGNGDCASCFHTDYNGPQCLYNPCVAIIIVAPTTDWYCNSRNGQNQCTGCYAGYYVNAPTSTPVNGAVCVPASPWCQNYVPVGGACNQCWSPYRPASPGSPLCVYP